MEQKTLWSKMTGWLKPGADSGRAGLHSGDLSPREAGADTETASEPATLSLLDTLSKRRRNEIAIEKLHEGHNRVIDLIDSLQKHQARQDERSLEISHSLTAVSAALTDIQGSSREQAERLAQIADALRVGNERVGRWDETLAELPQLATAQREALALVAQHLEASGQREGRMSTSLDSFREAVTSLSDATTSSSVAVKSLQMSTLENHERVASLMKEQNKRFLMLFAVTLVMVVIAIVAGMVALFRN